MRGCVSLTLSYWKMRVVTISRLCLGFRVAIRRGGGLDEVIRNIREAIELYLGTLSRKRRRNH